MGDYDKKLKLKICAAAYYVMASGEILKSNLANKVPPKKDVIGLTLFIKVEISKYLHYFKYYSKDKFDTILNLLEFVFRYNATNMLHDLKINPSTKFQNFCRMSSTA
jgi:hypothetical protein